MQVGALAPYERALRTGGRLGLVDSLGRRHRLEVGRWVGALDPADESVLRRCRGPVLDVGCGPGRFVAALTERGVSALGIDIAPGAVRAARRRGANVLCRDLFDTDLFDAALPDADLPGTDVPGTDVPDTDDPDTDDPGTDDPGTDDPDAGPATAAGAGPGAASGSGRWRTVLLLDGNIGIGGDPRAVLRRAAGLLVDDGEVLVEADGSPLAAAAAGGEEVLQARFVDRSGRHEPVFDWAIVGPAAVRRHARGSGLRVTESWTVRGRPFLRLAAA